MVLPSSNVSKLWSDNAICWVCYAVSSILIPALDLLPLQFPTDGKPEIRPGIPFGWNFLFSVVFFLILAVPSALVWGRTRNYLLRGVTLIVPMSALPFGLILLAQGANKCSRSGVYGLTENCQTEEFTVFAFLGTVLSMLIWFGLWAWDRAKNKWTQRSHSNAQGEVGSNP